MIPERLTYSFFFSFCITFKSVFVCHSAKMAKADRSGGRRFDIVKRQVDDRQVKIPLKFDDQSSRRRKRWPLGLSRACEEKEEA